MESNRVRELESLVEYQQAEINDLKQIMREQEEQFKQTFEDFSNAMQEQSRQVTSYKSVRGS